MDADDAGRNAADKFAKVSDIILKNINSETWV